MVYQLGYSSRLLAVNIVAIVYLIASGSTFAGTNVLTWHNNLARSGLNTHEYILRPNNVNITDFGKLFMFNVDGQIYAQPLIVSGLKFPGWGVYNVLYVATEHDSLYAIDADTGLLLWHVSLLGPGETPADTDECDPITPEVGITATPVIDRSSGPRGMIYVVTMSKDAAGNYFQRLHALDLTTGYGVAVEIIATFPGTGDNSSNGNVVFDPRQYYERAGLALSNGVVYTTWAGRHDCRPYTSWVIGYDQHTLAQVSVLNLTHNGYQGAIWQSAAAPAVDSNGFLYVALGNGSFDTTLDVNGFPNQGDFGNCLVKLDPRNSLHVADYWTMFNTLQESTADLDLSSGGPLLLPDMTDANDIPRHLAVVAGKDTHIYIADRDNMGKFNPTGNITLYQDLAGSLGGYFGGSNFSTPAYFNGALYFGAIRDVLRRFTFTNGRLNGAAVSTSTNTFGYPGTTPSISANGTAYGILWAAENASPAVLHAYDARDLSHELYNSNQAANSRDHFGSNAKFITPTIANGKVYVATTGGTVGAFGLFNSPRLESSGWRAYVGLGDEVLTGKFVVQGSGLKTVVFRARGPSLQVNARLQNPVLELYDGNGQLVASDDDWATDVNAGWVQGFGLAPSDSREAALARMLSTGSYTLVVRGAGNTTGVGQLEIIDLSQPPSATVATMSARSLIANGQVLTGGITVAGRASQTVLFRAIGPDLNSQGIPFALPNPTLEVYNIHGTLIASNDNWKSNQQAKIQATGLAPGDDRDAAVLLNLQPGQYWAVVRGANGTIGIAQLEAYALQL
jgi:hypothetical protein